METTYKFTSDQEPTDAELQFVMEQACKVAYEKALLAEKQYKTVQAQALVELRRKWQKNQTAHE